MAASNDIVERVFAAADRAAERAEQIAGRVVPEEERSLIGRVMELSLHKKVLLARRLWRDPRMGAAARTPLIAGLVYAVLPLKFTPKFLGPLRDFEKIVGLGVLLWLLIRLAPRDVIAEHLEALEPPDAWDRVRGWRK